MKKSLLGAVMAVFFVGCGAGEVQELVEEYPPVDSSTSELRDQPPSQFCFGFCPSTPSNEPLGQLCRLSSQACLNGILTCYYSCVELEPRPY